MSVVLDCSIALAWVMPDEQSAFADEVLAQVAEIGGFVPPLFRIEVGDALLLAVRRERVVSAFRARAFERIGALPLTVDADGMERVWTSAIDLADRFGLSLYDATYLELAQRLRLPLATLDQRLAQASHDIGVGRK